MSRRRKSSQGDKEWLYKRSIDLVCPVDRRHRLGSVDQDSYRTTFHPRALLNDDDTMQGAPRGDLRRDRNRLRASCARCGLAGSRGDFQVSLALVLAVFDRMANHGPRARTLALDSTAFRAVTDAEPLAADAWLTSTSTVLEWDDSDRGSAVEPAREDPVDRLLERIALRRAAALDDEPFDPSEI